MHWIDWSIVLGLGAAMTMLAYSTKRYTRSVADFLAANRCGGRYLLGIAQDMAGTGAISIVANMQMMFIAGFTAIYWGWMSLPVGLFISLSGFVVYRYRATRALTMAQFFEMRYSRRFRILAGLVAYLAGIVNFGIFPAVAARFFIYFCGLPDHWWVFALVMMILLAIALSFTLLGGQIAVMVTDFAQGMLCNVLFVVILLFAMSQFSWTQISDALATAPKDASLVNPFDTSNLEAFNYWYFLMGILMQFYGVLAWQGSSGYRCSAKSPHEARMAGILGAFRGFGLMLLFAMLPICAYTIMNHPDFSTQANAVHEVLADINLEGEELTQVTSQIKVPIAVRQFLPVGLVGAFVAVLFAAFLTTHDTYLHSWGSIFIQDVLLPFRKTPLSPQEHLKWLRISIAGVAVFIFMFSFLFRQTEHIALFFMITGAIFINGAGAAIVGGLYWRRGTTAAAWTAMIIGSTAAVGGIILQATLKDAFPVGTLWLTFCTMMMAAFSYVTVSLVGRWAAALMMAVLIGATLVAWQFSADAVPFEALPVLLFSVGVSLAIYLIAGLVGQSKPIDMDRLLHRGRHAVDDGDHEPTGSSEPRDPGIWKWFGMGKEFRFWDRVIYIGAIVKAILLFGFFLVALIAHRFAPMDFDFWIAFWKVFVTVFVVLAVAFTVWFTIGGILDIRFMYAALRNRSRDARDDGTIDYVDPGFPPPKEP